MRRRRLSILALSAAATTILLAACASSPSSAEVDAVGSWSGTGDRPASLTLAEDGSVTGTDGCNSAGGTFTVDGSRVSFTLGPMTLKACFGVNLSFVKLDHGVVDGDTMTLYTFDGTQLTTLTRS